MKKLKICGLNYTVEYIQPNSREDPFMGRTDPQKALITINQTMAEDVQQQTLIHEWLHAILSNYSLAENENETMIQALATELHNAGFKL
jgi:Zn-dependent peptidase ImmA (M78 family)